MKAEAEALLRERTHGRDRGRLRAEAIKTTVGDLQNVLEADYLANGQSVQRVKQRFARLLEYWKPEDCAEAITTTAIRDYQKKRIEQGAKNATVNRELAGLRRASRLAAMDGYVAVPKFVMLAENNIRKGFFEREQFEAVRRRLPEYMQPLVTFLYLSGWRIGEAVGLEWNRVDLKVGIIRLETGEAKSGEARTLPYAALPELAAVIMAQREVKTRLERERRAIVPLVFHHDGAPLFHGPVIGARLYKAWRAATKAAGVPGRFFHDFRRSAVRNMERAGVSRSVAMKITGHKTESIYKRYAIVSEKDIAEGLARLAPPATSAASRK